MPCLWLPWRQTPPPQGVSPVYRDAPGLAVLMLRGSRKSALWLLAETAPN